jgi:hypothetical protein
MRGEKRVFTWFSVFTHQTLTVDEWEAQNIFTGTISEDILGLLTMDMVH